MSIAAIETEYKGNRFRSRLEARWAVFFDTVNIKYRYETEGFENNETGERYLPDFYLPDFDLYAEVKGDEKQYWKDLPRIKSFIEQLDSPIKRLIVLGNMPNATDANSIFWYPILYRHPLYEHTVREYRTIIYTKNDKGGYGEITLNWRSGPGWYWKADWDGDIEMTPYSGCEFVLNRDRLDPVPDEYVPEEDGDFIDINCIPSFDGDTRCYFGFNSYSCKELADAYKKARSARFEFGESGTGGKSE